MFVAYFHDFDRVLYGLLRYILLRKTPRSGCRRVYYDDTVAMGNIVHWTLNDIIEFWIKKEEKKNCKYRLRVGGRYRNRRRTENSVAGGRGRGGDREKWLKYKENNNGDNNDLVKSAEVEKKKKLCS